MKAVQFSVIPIMIMLCIKSSELLAQIVFTEHNVVSNYSSPWSVVSIDMDNDGDIDLLGSARLGNRIDWWENDGYQNFTRHAISTTAYYAMGVGAGDLDNDGDIDVVCGLNQNSCIKWWENDSMNFTEHYIADWVVNRLLIIDINGDHLPDIAASACEQGDNKIGWFENNGNRTFTAHVVKDNWDHANSVYAYDIDMDNDIDLLGTASFRTSGSQGEIAWFENDSTPFTEHMLISGYGRPSSVYSIDLDRDGDNDILATACLQNTLVWFENNGSQSFCMNIIGSDIVRPHDVKAADLDLDGDYDIITSAIGSNDISWWENNGLQLFTKRTITSSFGGASEISLCDLDQDGDLDIVGAGQTANKISWWENRLVIGIKGENIKSKEIFNLNQNYPNPFNLSTTISFDLLKQEQVHLTIYNCLGQRVQELVNRELPAGTYSVEWNASGMASGIYLYKISAGGYESVKKMILSK